MGHDMIIVRHLAGILRDRDPPLRRVWQSCWGPIATLLQGYVFSGDELVSFTQRPASG